MRSPESWMEQIGRLRKLHTQNAKLGRWQANDTVRRKIILAWAGYHASLTLETPSKGTFKYGVKNLLSGAVWSRHREKRSADRALAIQSRKMPTQLYTVVSL